MSSTSKRGKSEFLEINIDFEIFSKKTAKIVLHKDVSLYELEQMLLHKLNIPQKQKWESSAIRVNERIVENYKKELHKISEIKENKIKIKFNLDEIISHLLDFDTTNIPNTTNYQEDNKDNQMNDLLNTSNYNNCLKENTIPVVPLGIFKIDKTSQRGLSIISETCSLNGNYYTLSSFNFTEFNKLSFDSDDLISFSNYSHRQFMKPIAKILDVQLSEHCKKIKHKNLYPNSTSLCLNTLERRVMEEDELPDSQKWEVLYQICDILDYFHDHNLIHGNLAPFHVIVQQIESIFLIDFGLSRNWQFVEDVEDIKENTISKNLLYSPPEYLLNQIQFCSQFKASSDIWAIGCIIYFMFTKKHPWLTQFNNSYHSDIKTFLDETFKSNEIFYLSEINDIDPLALILIQGCCRQDYESRLSIKHIKLFIMLIASKKCPQLLHNIKEILPKEDIDFIEFPDSNMNSIYSERNHIQRQITKVAEIFSSKVLIQGLLENYEMNDSDVKLDFSNESLGNDKLIFLGNFFSYLNRVKSIDIRSNSISLQGFEGILSLYNNFRTKLQKFYLDKNPINQNNFQSFANSIIDNKCYIKILSLNGCSTRIGDIIPFLKSLNKLIHLEYIDLTSNFIGDYEFTLICQNFKYTTRLKDLILTDNLIRGKGIFYFIKNAKSLVDLQMFNLNLSYNKLGNEGFKEFAKIFSCINHIFSINLESNNAGDEGICYLFNYMADQAVKLNMACQVDTLNLNGNDFTDEAGNKIITYFSILKNKYIKNGIKNFSFLHNNLSQSIEKKIMELHNNTHHDSYRVNSFINEEQNEITSVIKLLDCCLSVKCPSIKVSNFKVLQKVIISDGNKIKNSIYKNSIKISHIDTVLFNDLRLAERFYESQLRISKKVHLSLNHFVDFYPHLLRGDKFPVLDYLKCLSNNKQYSRLECIEGEITIIVFFLFIPICLSKLKDLNNLLILKKDKWKEKVKVKAILYGSLQELNKLENKEIYQNFDFYVLDAVGEEAFTYMKLFFDYDVTNLDGYIMGKLPIILVNKYKTIAMIGKINILEIHDCVTALILSNSDTVYSRKRNNVKNKLENKTEHIEVSEIDHKVLKLIRQNMIFFQKTMKNNIKHYSFLFEYVESRDTIIGESLDVVGYNASKLKLNIFVRKHEAIFINKFFSNKISKILPLDVFEIENNIMKTVDIKLGQDCKNCKCGKEKLFSYYGQYYCFWCNEYYCEKCGDIFDKPNKGLEKLVHYHNMIYIINNKTSEDDDFLMNIDLFKLGRPNIIEECKNTENIDDLFSDTHYIDCDYCDAELDQNFRYICLNCNPGYIKDSLVDFCQSCFDYFRGKNDFKPPIKSEESILIRNSHDIQRHNYLRVIASFGDYNKY